MRPLSFAAVRAWRWLTALVIAAAALWCTRGLLDIVNGPAGAVTRVAMLPPWWLLAILVVVFLRGWESSVALPYVVLVVALVRTGTDYACSWKFYVAARG